MPQRIDHGGKALRLHAHDLHLGLDGLGCRGNARNQTAAANGNDQRIQIGLCLQDFQRQRALARSYRFIVIGMDKGQLLLLRQLVGMGSRLGQCVAMQHHLGAEAACALHLHTGSEARHDDDGTQTQTLRVIGHALGMVARTHGDHAACALGIAEHEQLVQRATLLEGCSELQVLELEIDLRPRDLRERA